MHQYETNLASEFHVMSALYRCGADAALSLGNKKAVDITIVHEAGDTTTVDVKGVAGKHDWPANNVSTKAQPSHFVVWSASRGISATLVKCRAFGLCPMPTLSSFESGTRAEGSTFQERHCLQMASAFGTIGNRCCKAKLQRNTRTLPAAPIGPSPN
jgi:hypothetical protein